MKVKNPKSLIAATFALGSLLIGSTYTGASSQNIAVYLDGAPITFTDTQPMIVNNHTLVPIRIISENLGYTVNWDPNVQDVQIKGQNTLLDLVINEDQAGVNGR